MRNRSWRSACIPNLLAVLLLPASLLAEPITLRHAVELALKHANGAAIAADDEQHASAAYRELRNNYIPQGPVGAVSSRTPRLHARRPNRIRSRFPSQQRPAQSNHSRHRPHLRRTPKMG